MRIPPIFVYDTSGPFGDKKLGTHFRNRVDVHKGIQSTRGKWIKEREDTRELNTPSANLAEKNLKEGMAIQYSQRNLCREKQLSGKM